MNTKIRVIPIKANTPEELALAIEKSQNVDNKNLICKGSQVYYDSTNKKHCCLVFYAQSLENLKDVASQKEVSKGEDKPKSSPKKPFKLTEKDKKKWAKEKPSKKQRDFLERNNIRVPETKLDAYMMINTYVENQKEI